MAKDSILKEHYAQISSYFNTLEDPRRTIKGNIHYPLIEILFLTISAAVSGANDWVAVEVFGEAKLDWLRGFYPYKNGTPSHDTLGRFFNKLCPQAFEECFREWIKSLPFDYKDTVVAIDGKTARGSYSDNKKALHIVSAYATENGLCLGQIKTEEKSNEITAIPKLLNLIEVKGAIVTIDAMGCQKDIAEEIIGKKADYLLQVKGNQKNLATQITERFNQNVNTKSWTDTDCGHGRIETRLCQVIDDLDFMTNKADWKEVKSVARIYSERICKKTGERSTYSRYYISSLQADPVKIGKATRSHWAIENNLHWNLDVIFQEDKSLKKKGYSAENYNIIAKAALTLIDQEKSNKKSKNSKRQLAALDDKYRVKILRV